MTLLPMATVFALEFTAPAWVSVMAVLFLGERLTLPRIAAVVLGFVGVLVVYARKILEAYGVKRLKAGDMIVVNDPFLWATHLPDVAVFAPIFADGHAEMVTWQFGTNFANSRPDL